MTPRERGNLAAAEAGLAVRAPFLVAIPFAWWQGGWIAALAAGFLYVLVTFAKPPRPD